MKCEILVQYSKLKKTPNICLWVSYLQCSSVTSASLKVKCKELAASTIFILDFSFFIVKCCNNQDCKTSGVNRWKRCQEIDEYYQEVRHSDSLQSLSLFYDSNLALLVICKISLIKISNSGLGGRYLSCVPELELL